MIVVLHFGGIGTVKADIVRLERSTTQQLQSAHRGKGVCDHWYFRFGLAVHFVFILMLSKVEFGKAGVVMVCKCFIRGSPFERFIGSIQASWWVAVDGNTNYDGMC